MEKNQLLINYYEKEEIKKVKTRQQEGMTIKDIIELADKEYITVDEIKEILGFIDEEIEVKSDENKGIGLITEGNKIINDTKTEKCEIVMIKDSNLEDYPNQPFNLYKDDKKKEMMESIKINGIMQPLIVRPITNGKYQILSGHNRRICGKAIGITSFPCIVKSNLTDAEAEIYLVDTNLCTREQISIMERAKAYRIKFDAYKKQNVKINITEEIKKDISGLGLARAPIINEEKSSNGSVQRYLRLTYLMEELQEKVENKKISINVGEKISFIPLEEQAVINELIDENIKITDKIAQRIKKKSESIKREDIYNYLSKNDMLDLVESKSKVDINKKVIRIIFYENEIKNYFNGLENEKEIKEYILEKIKI